MKQSIWTYLLAILIFLEGIGACFGSGALILAPDGRILEMPVDLLTNTPFPDFLIPGIILGLLLGVLPILVSIGLVFRPIWSFFERFNIFPDKYWAWTFSIYVGIMLIIWIDVQVYWIGGGSLLQLVYGLWGVVILVFSLLPPVQKWAAAIKK